MHFISFPNILESFEGIFLSKNDSFSIFLQISDLWCPFITTFFIKILILLGKANEFRNLFNKSDNKIILNKSIFLQKEGKSQKCDNLKCFIFLLLQIISKELMRYGSYLTEETRSSCGIFWLVHGLSSMDESFDSFPVSIRQTLSWWSIHMTFSFLKATPGTSSSVFWGFKKSLTSSGEAR